MGFEDIRSGQNDRILSSHQKDTQRVLDDFRKKNNNDPIKFAASFILEFERGYITDNNLLMKIRSILDSFIIEYNDKDYHTYRNSDNTIDRIEKTKRIDENTKEIITLLHDRRIQADIWHKTNKFQQNVQRTIYSNTGGIHTTNYQVINDCMFSTDVSFSKNGKNIWESHKSDDKTYGDFDFEIWKKTINKNDGSIVEVIHNNYGKVISAKGMKDGKLIWQESIDRITGISTLTIYNENGKTILVRDSLNYLMLAENISNADDRVQWTIEDEKQRVNQYRYFGDKYRFTRLNEDDSINEDYTFPMEEFHLQFFNLTGFLLTDNNYQKPDR